MDTPGDPSPWDPPAPGLEPVLARARFNVTAADVAAAWRAHLRWYYTRLTAWMVPLLLGFALMVVDAAVYPRSSAALLAVPLVGVPVLVLVSRCCRYALLPLLARRTWRQTRSYHAEWQVELTPAGNRARAAGFEHFVPWTHYVAWFETDKVVLLYHSDANFQFFPRRAADNDVMQAFRTLTAGLKKR